MDIGYYGPYHSMVVTNNMADLAFELRGEIYDQ